MESSAGLFTVITEGSNLGAKLINLVLIASGHRNGQGEFKFFKLVTALEETGTGFADRAEWVAFRAGRLGQRAGGIGVRHGCISFHSVIPPGFGATHQGQKQAQAALEKDSR
ncbi:hypothetical protein KQ306_09760 [Synechococcus sp. CS-1324]|uniref:hypothetical protein n=1 Tax=Synechococcus sp. CS-1324 TaxID=2847980 RepID=UPI00288062AC|nr:hypothetical protein [Synechococcus sp. CS-1324]MCT0231132.1 hypothetical protein [Synechococcus sp. CS-1324]